MTYNTPFPRQAPWFIYGPYLAPSGKWLAGYVCANGQLELDINAVFDNEEDAYNYFAQRDYGLTNANATA